MIDSNTHTPVDGVAEKIAHVQDFLRGYGRPDGERLLPLIVFHDWPLQARRVLAARCTRILENLDDETLHMVCDGRIVMPDVVAGVAIELGAL